MRRGVRCSGRRTASASGVRRASPVANSAQYVSRFHLRLGDSRIGITGSGTDRAVARTRADPFQRRTSSIKGRSIEVTGRTRHNQAGDASACWTAGGSKDGSSSTGKTCGNQGVDLPSVNLRSAECTPMATALRQSRAAKAASTVHIDLRVARGERRFASLARVARS